MKEKERLIISGLVVLMLVLWLGFPFHQSPRFAGSLWGGILGVVGAVLMLVPLAYMVVKRNKRLKKYVSKWVSMRTLLAWHIYAGVLGPVLVVIHSGHKDAAGCDQRFCGPLPDEPVLSGDPREKGHAHHAADILSTGGR